MGYAWPMLCMVPIHGLREAAGQMLMGFLMRSLIQCVLLRPCRNTWTVLTDKDRGISWAVEYVCSVHGLRGDAEQV